MINTQLDRELHSLLLKIDNDEMFTKGTFLRCRSQEDRLRLFEFIREGHTNRKEIIFMAGQIGIESGTTEGEFIEGEFEVV